MNTVKRHLPNLILAVWITILAVFMASVCPVFGATYYVDSSITDTHVASATPDFTTYNPTTFETDTGSDSVYKTIADINACSFSAGDSILFKKGDTWREQLTMPSSGSAGNPITFGAYGSGANPVIKGSDPITGFTQSITYQQDGATTAYNTYDSELNAAAPTTNYGSAANILVRGLPTYDRRMILAFPNIIGTGSMQIPSGSTISSAILTIDNQWGGSNCTGHTVKAYRINRNWAPATNEGNVTYNTYDGSNAWTTPGGDYDATEVGSYTFAGENPATLTFDVTASIQAFSDGTANYGWIIKWDGTEDANAFFQPTTRDSATASRRPKLTVISSAGGSGYVYNVPCALGGLEGTGITRLQVFEDGVRLNKAANLGAMDAGSFFWAADILYVWCSDSALPSTHTIEYTSRWSCINLNDQDYINIDSIGALKPAFHGYEMGYTSSSSIYINVSNATASYGYRGFSIQKTGAAPTASNIVFTNCVSHDTFDEGFWICGTASGLVNCEAYNGGKDRALNGNVGDGGGVLIGGGATNCYVLNSYFHDIPYNYSVAIEDTQAGMGDNDGTIVKHNRIDALGNTGNSTAALWITALSSVVTNNLIRCDGTQAGIKVGSEGMTTTGTSIYNNVVQNNSNNWSLYANNTATGIVFKNNIITGTGKGLALWTASKTGFVSDYNDLFSAQTYYWEGSANPASFAAWQSASSQDAHSLSADPLFVSTVTPDFHLQPNSPCINAGVDVGLTTDYLGYPMIGVPDIGAYETQISGTLAGTLAAMTGSHYGVSYIGGSLHGTMAPVTGSMLGGYSRLMSTGMKNLGLGLGL